MKTKDLVYIGVIGVLAFLLLKKKSLPTTTQDAISNGNNPPMGNSTNGGLNLGQNMDLPNLTPTSPNGMSTETALNSSNITPLVKDDSEPTQVFGAILPPELQQSGSTSNINTNPIDVLNNQNNTNSNNSDEPTQVFGNYDLPNPYGTSTINPNPIDVVPNASNNSVSTTPTPQASTTPTPQASTTPTPQIFTTPSAEVEVPDNTVVIMPRPIVPATSSIVEPVFGVKDTVPLQSQVPILNSPKEVVTEPIKDTLISECGNSFSIPNNDKEGSYTNYWFDGITFYMQTTSPYIKTIPNKITKDLFFEGCKKLQEYNLKNTKS